MKLNFYKPKSKILEKYIEGYYFIAEDIQSEAIRYVTFPNNFCIVSINENADVTIAPNEIAIQKSKNANMLTSVVSRYIKPIQIHYVHPVNELTIYFKPLGINHFLDSTAVLYSKSTLLNFKLFPDFDEKIKSIFRLNTSEQQYALEKYLETKLEVKNFTLLEKILQDIETDTKIEDIALNNNISRQYLNKIFKKHIGKSLTEYRKIHRFRNSLMLQKQSKNFTELSSYAFYDQSHFIRNFKELTQTKPNSFFKKVAMDKDNIWLFI